MKSTLLKPSAIARLVDLKRKRRFLPNLLSRKEKTELKALRIRFNLSN